MADYEQLQILSIFVIAGYSTPILPEKKLQIRKITN
jgi:hypothetical protein